MSLSVLPENKERWSVEDISLELPGGSWGTVEAQSGVVRRECSHGDGNPFNSRQEAGRVTMRVSR